MTNTCYELFLIFNIQRIVDRFLDAWNIQHHVLIHTVGHGYDISIKWYGTVLKTYLIQGQLDLSSERHQGTDNSQDPEQEEEYRGATASHSFQLDDA